MVFSKELALKICGMIEEGMTQRDAAILSGGSEASLYRWIKEKKTVEIDGETKSFKSLLEASLLRYKQKLVQVVNIGSLKDPKVALEMLARRFPDEYGAKQKVEIIDPQREINRMMNIIEGKESPDLEEDIEDDEPTDEQVPENGGNLLPEQGGRPDETNSGSE